MRYDLFSLQYIGILHAQVIQIAARGTQDAILNADPTHTIWRSVHIRFTSCALDDELQEFTNIGFDTTGTVTVNRYGVSTTIVVAHLQHYHTTVVI